MTDLEKKVYDLGVLPVIKIDNAKDAVPLARALCDGGLPAAEITFRTACAAEAIANIKKAVPACGIVNQILQNEMYIFIHKITLSKAEFTMIDMPHKLPLPDLSF